MSSKYPMINEYRFESVPPIESYYGDVAERDKAYPMGSRDGSYVSGKTVGEAFEKLGDAGPNSAWRLDTRRVPFKQVIDMNELRRQRARTSV